MTERLVNRQVLEIYNPQTGDTQRVEYDPVLDGPKIVENLEAQGLTVRNIGTVVYSPMQGTASYSIDQGKVGSSLPAYPTPTGTETEKATVEQSAERQNAENQPVAFVSCLFPHSCFIYPMRQVRKHFPMCLQSLWVHFELRVLKLVGR